MAASIPTAMNSVPDPNHPLARAFASFTEAAGSLERTYGQLHGQVAHLRQELEVTNHDLARSVEENHRIRERLRRIVEGLPCGVLVLEGDSKISILNPEAVRLLGHAAETKELLHPVLGAALDQARERGEEMELQVSGENSDGPWVALRHARLEQEAPHDTSVFILRDISEAKKLEQERETLRRQLALVEMSALLAHEIRNPLGSLELFAGLLAEANLEGESARWIEHVQAGLRTLSATVNNVLQLHNGSQLEWAPMDAGDLLDWAYDFLLPLAHQARVELQVENGLRGVVVNADRHQLEQVMLNLALNGFHFMAGGGWLLIRGVNRAASGIEIGVTDTGPGILPEDLPRIFEPGFSTRPGSSGLGLSVCRQILERHGGTITADSYPGRGATFRIHLPSPDGAAS